MRATAALIAAIPRNPLIAEPTGMAEQPRSDQVLIRIREEWASLLHEGAAGRRVAGGTPMKGQHGTGGCGTCHLLGVAGPIGATMTPAERASLAGRSRVIALGKDELAADPGADAASVPLVCEGIVGIVHYLVASSP